MALAELSSSGVLGSSRVLGSSIELGSSGELVPLLLLDPLPKSVLISKELS